MAKANQSTPERDALRAATLGTSFVPQRIPVSIGENQFEAIELTAGEYDLVLQAARGDEGKPSDARMRIQAIVQGIVVPGTTIRVYEKGDVAVLATQSRKLIRDLSEPVLKLSGLSDDGLSPTENAEKNSEATPSDN